MKRLRGILPVLLILALATLACGLDLSKLNRNPQPTPQATQAPVSEAQPTATATQAPVEATEAQSPTAEATPEAAEIPTASGAEGEEVPLDLNTSVSGLDNLNSYRSTFRVDWKGTKGGQPVAGYLDMRSAYVREPAARELQLESQGLGQGEGVNKVSFIQVGDTAWFYDSSSDTWTQLPAGDIGAGEGFLFDPKDLLTNFEANKGRRSLLPQPVNGVQCYKYTFNEKDFVNPSDPARISRAQGEVYVAVDGGYIVKLVINADVRYTDPNEMFEEGTITMTFDILDINQPITIQPPAEAKAQTGREDIPMLPDAKVELASAELVSYRTASSIEEAAQFYQDEMPRKDWTAGEGNMVTAESALLSYTKGGETANIIIGSGENGTSVMISITKE